MAEIIGAVVIITVLVMVQLYLFLDDNIDGGTKILMGIMIFFTAVIAGLINFLLNLGSIGI